MIKKILLRLSISGAVMAALLVISGGTSGSFAFAQANRESEKPDSAASSQVKPVIKEYDGPSASAIYAGGCFWGVEYYLESLDGVYDVISGYTGGNKENPTYYEVLSQTTGHVEAVQVFYNPDIISYEELTKFFFEIHDPTQTDGQGPDIGEQYLSVIFYDNEEERSTVEKLIGILEHEGYDVATMVKPADTFWPAETYHQDYYETKGSLPYCHSYIKRFP
jgi:peptide methionine sulfoxide reductase msrA/msrB